MHHRFYQYKMVGKLAGWAWFIIGFFLWFHVAHAAQLVMVDSKTCHYCQLWHEEIGEGYPYSAEGKIAPLRIIQIENIPNDLSHLQGIIYTPTFILMDEEKEIDRITGYPGKDFFYPLLSNMLEKLEEQP